jgi:hypothetical protein
MSVLSSVIAHREMFGVFAIRYKKHFPLIKLYQKQEKIQSSLLKENPLTRNSVISRVQSFCLRVFLVGERRERLDDFLFYASIRKNVEGF